MINDKQKIYAALKVLQAKTIIHYATPIDKHLIDLVMQCADDKINLGFFNDDKIFKNLKE